MRVTDIMECTDCIGQHRAMPFTVSIGQHRAMPFTVSIGQHRAMPFTVSIGYCTARILYTLCWLVILQLPSLV